MYTKALFVSLFLGACSATVTSNDPATGGGGGKPGGDRAPAADCPSRCAALASKCAQPSDGCDGFCQGATEAQLSCLEAAGCDPDAERACAPSSSASSSAGSSSSSSSSNNSGDSGSASKPAEVTITATLTASDPTGSRTDGKTAYLLSEKAPSFQQSPQPGEQINLFNLKPDSVSPSPGSCAQNGVFLNLDSDGTVTFQATGVDTDPATDCAQWMGALRASGSKITLTFAAAPYVNGGTVKVTANLGY